MERIGAVTFVNDFFGAVPKKHVDERIHRELAHSLAEKIVEHDMERIIMKRESESIFNHFPNRPGTEYRLDVYLLTPSEHKEYEELKRFQSQMKNFVGGI